MDVLLERNEVCLRADDATLRVGGAPDFDDAAELARAGVQWLEGREGQVAFDACSIHNTSSAMLAVLLEWLRAARVRQLEVSAVVLSERLLELVELAGLNEVFPIRVDVC